MIVKKIGQGTYASIFLMKNKNENKLYAAKTFLKSRHFATLSG